ncbi:Phosphofructokinase 5 [Heracleum sosnowskyi]|uniref:Phosphofructokinase 5 n=1 Tax=Heracleum sosnowskyi TaxID=360622 RepID=A0AAD8MFW5_9APIA|nr:Phosphofructokinase 5 [Heracleum sosnowskyi]
MAPSLDCDVSSLLCAEKNESIYFDDDVVEEYQSPNFSNMGRFLSAYKLPTGEEWMMQLLAVACLSLAAKMEETEVPLSINLQVGESKILFEAKTIQRMELLVLSTLKWRMQSITPFSFIDRFLTNTMGDHLASRLPVFRSTQLILSMINGIDLLEFRPSEIAAAAALSVAGENQTVDTEKALYRLDHRLGKERVAKCVELMKKSSSWSSLSAISSNGSNELIQSSLPQSPIEPGEGVQGLTAFPLSLRHKKEVVAGSGMKRRWLRK